MNEVLILDCFPFIYSSTDTCGNRCNNMEPLEANFPAEIRHRSVDLVHGHHSDAISLHFLHESTAAEHHGATSGSAGR